MRKSSTKSGAFLIKSTLIIMAILSVFTVSFKYTGVFIAVTTLNNLLCASHNTLIGQAVYDDDDNDDEHHESGHGLCSRILLYYTNIKWEVHSDG